MFSTHILAFFTAGLALAGSVIAEPVAAPAPAIIDVRSPGSGAALAVVSKRQSEDILSSLQGWATEVSGLTSQINAAKEAGDLSYETHAPLIQAITASTQSLNGDLSAIEPAGLLVLRQSNDEVANLVAGVLSGIADAVDGLTGNPLLAGLLPGLDTSLAAVLRSLERLLADVLRLVANLLDAVAALLRRLAFGLTLAAIGL